MLLSQFPTTCIVVAGCIGHVTAGFGFRGSRQAPAAVPSVDPAINPDIAPPRERQVSISESLARVQATIDSVAMMPSCKKLAASDLLQSCESFEDRQKGQQSSGDKHLEVLENIFAIRVTNCEQMNANDVMPDVCRPLLEIGFYSKTLPHIVSNCLEALNSGHPNRWTTFRGVKLEGLLMCRAMRAEADKDDQINLYNVLINAMSDVNGVINLQKGELQDLTAGVSGLRGQMRDFQDTLLQDNQEIKAMAMGFTAELKNSMAIISEGHQAMMQGVEEAAETFGDHLLRWNMAAQQAIIRRDETDAQWEAKVQTYQDGLELYQQKQMYLAQQVLEVIHTAAYSINQSMETTVSYTSALADTIGQISFEANAPLQKVTALNSGAEELSTKFERMTETSNETLQILVATHHLAGRFFNFAERISDMINGLLKNMTMFTAYFIVIFLASLYLMWRFVYQAWWVSLVAGVIAAWFSMFCAWVHSPFALGRSVIAHHPTFFSPIYWSMLTVALISIACWETAKQGYWYLRPLEAEYELSLPVSENKGVDEKV